MDKNNNGLISGKALDYLKHKFSISSTHGLPFGFGFSWSIVGEWRAGKYVDLSTSNAQPYPRVVLLDARVFWNGAFITLFVDSSNLLNKRYFDYANVEQAGRWITAGVNIKINGK
jgi:outer membrane receptor protein involved in Fe transport